MTPPTEASIADLADTATMIIHELNLRTRGRHAFTEPAELARLLQALTDLTSGLPQLLTQLDRWLHHEHQAGRLHPHDHHTGELVEAASAHLTLGRRTAHALTATIDTTHQLAADLAAAPPHRQETEKPRKGVNIHP